MPQPVVRQLRDFVVGAVLALLVATGAFVAVRNHELADRQTELAARAAEAIAEGKTLPPGVHGVRVGRAEPSQRNPYLRQRRVQDGDVWRPLSAAGGADDKLFYDAASRYARSRPHTEPDLVAASLHRAQLITAWIAAGQASRDEPGRAATRSVAQSIDRARALAAEPLHDLAFHELLPDGSGRAIGLVPVELVCARGGNAPCDPVCPGDACDPSSLGDLAIAVTPPAAPAPYPWLVLIGVFGLGAAIAAAGGLANRPRLGTFAGVATLAIPCVLWRAPVATTAILILAAALALAQGARLTDRLAGGVRRHRTALGFLAPAAIAMLVLVAAPFVIGLVIGFYDHHQGQWTFVGFDNFGEILSGGGRPLDDPLNFWFILGVTVLWTAANVALHVTIGVALAVALSRTWIRGKPVFRMLFILPWAIPNYITALIWKGMFNAEHGAINSLLHYAGVDHGSWFSTWAQSFSANVITNTWLGFPFMMVVALGALETIPKELYEAASVDGASAWQRFRHITLPHLRPALGPAVVLGSIWTFNMFNVIYLVSAGDPGGSTNILVTDAYRWAFERGERYGMAAAYATIIFFILLLWTVFGTRVVRSKEDA